MNAIAGSLAFAVMFSEFYKEEDANKNLLTYFRQNLKREYLIFGNSVVQAIVDNENDLINKKTETQCRVEWKKFSNDLRTIKRRSNNYHHGDLYKMCWGIQEIYSFQTVSNQVYSDNLQHIIRFTTLLLRHLILNPNSSYESIADFKENGLAFHEPSVHRRPFLYEWNHPLWLPTQYEKYQIAAGVFFKRFMESCKSSIVTRIFVDSSLMVFKKKYTQNGEVKKFKNFIAAKNEICFNREKPSLKKIGMYTLFNSDQDFEVVFKGWDPYKTYIWCAEQDQMFKNVLDFYTYVFTLLDAVYNSECSRGDAPRLGGIIGEIDFSTDLHIEHLKCNLYWMLGRNFYRKNLDDDEHFDIYVAFISTWDFVLYNVYNRSKDIFEGTGRDFFLTLIVMRWLMTRDIFRANMWKYPSRTENNIVTLTDSFFLSQICVLSEKNGFKVFSREILYGSRNLPM